jgi:alkylation response protein AidB-like acyl-CoA dehydrogenase
VDSGVTDDQRLLMETAARFAEEAYPLSRVRAGAYFDGEVAADYRRRAGDLGWFSMLVPERLGGGCVSGDGLVDAALIAYERGRGLQPAPFVATNVTAFALATAGSEEQQAKVLPGLVSGEIAAAWAAPVAAGGGRLAPEVGAEPAGAGFRLTGRAAMVDGAGPGACLLVAATSPEGPVQALVEPGTAGVSMAPLESLDISRRFAEVRFEGAEVPAGAVLGDATGDLIGRQLAIACVLTAAESVGAMARDFEMALQYAKDRVAFGRPIGSFQAVKHLLADTSLLLEMSKAITLAAAGARSDEDHGLQAASMAKAFVGDSGIDLAQNCHQVFGGISFTWEHDQHLYLRRITTDAALYGDPGWHRERLCQLAGI